MLFLQTNCALCSGLYSGEYLHWEQFIVPPDTHSAVDIMPNAYPSAQIFLFNIVFFFITSPIPLFFFLNRRAPRTRPRLHTTGILRAPLHREAPACVPP